MALIDRPLHVNFPKDFKTPKLPVNDWYNAQIILVKQKLIPVAWWLGILFSFITIYHFFFLKSSHAPLLSMMSAVTAVIYFLNLFFIKKFTLPENRVYPCAFILVGLALVNIFSFLILFGDPSQTIILLLIIILIPFFIVSHSWFFSLLTIILFCWICSTIITPALAGNLNTIIGLIVSLVFAVLFHFNQYQIHKKIIESEYQEHDRKTYLEEIIKEMELGNHQLLLNNTALEAAANGIAITDREGYFLWVNPAFSKITGYSSIETIGKKPSILKSGLEGDAFYNNMWQTIIHRKVWSGNIINRRKDGTLYHEEQTITPVINENGQITHFIGVKQDVSVRVKAQEALENRNQELVQLNNAISTITSSLNMDEVKKNIVDTVKQILPQVFGATLQLVNDKGRLVTKTASLRSTSLNPDNFFQPGVGAAGLAVQKGIIINIGDIENDPRFRKSNLPSPFKSLISIPIIYKDKTFGALSVEGKIINAFGPSEERLLKLLSDYVAAAIQNALYSENLEGMIEERTAELRKAQEKLLAQQQIEQEIKLAVDIQESLLPHHVPNLPGFSIAAAAYPAHSVSGDFYDFIEIEDDLVSFVLADIAGKGIPAAMLTSTARSLMRISSENGQSPAAALCEVNNRLYDDLTHAGMFITMLSARLEADIGRVTYANAGHTETLLWHNLDSSVQTIPVTGIPLGILKDFDLGEKEIMFHPGDVLLFYSDGITEATNPCNQLFGLDNLIKILKENPDREPDDLMHMILNEVDIFCQGLPHSDDITLVILKAEPRLVPFVYPAVLDQLESISLFIRQNALMFGNDFAYQIDLATSEIITNIITHAYSSGSGNIRGEIKIIEDRIVIDLFDEGTSFNLDSLPDVDFSQPHEGGYGLFIVKKLVDVITYEPVSPHGNHWHIEKKAHRE